MDTPPARNKNTLWLLPFLLTGVAASLLAVAWLAIAPQLDRGPGVDPLLPETVKLSRDDSIKLSELRNRSLGNLENHEFAQADAALTEIIQLLPADPFGPRNLAISRQLALDALDKHRDPQRFAQASTLADEAIKSFRSADPDSFIGPLIAARVALKQDQNETALQELREAIRLNPGSVGPFYDLFALSQVLPGEQLGEEGFKALRTVYQKESNNLFVIKDWLPTLVQRRDPEFASEVKRVQETIAPFVETIKTNTRIDLHDILEKSAMAAQEGNWQIAQRSMTIFRNLIISEAARDKRFVALDSLEYLLLDFGKDFQDRADLPEPDGPLPNAVHFQPMADQRKDLQAAGSRDVAIADFDLNGDPDLMVLLDRHIVIWQRNRDGQTWDQLATSETGGDYSGILAYDFDDDVDQEVKNFPTEQQPADALKHEYRLSRLTHTADPDVILYGAAGLKLFENKKEPQSERRSLVTRAAGDAFEGVKDVTAACVVDVDNDGDLDLVAATATGVRIFSNRGNMTFEDTTSRSILPPDGVAVTRLAIVDWDKDADVDLLVATSEGAGWLENIRHGRLRFHSLDEFSVLKNATSLVIGDFNGDLSWDILSAGPDGATATTTRISPGGTVTKVQSSSLGSSPIKAASLGDFDNDGTTDAILIDATHATIFRGDGQGRFTEVPRAAADWLAGTARVVVRDLDHDGDLDLLAVQPAGVTGYSSQCRESDNPGNGWQEIQLIGYQVKPGEQNNDKRTNHINLGGLVELKAGARYQSKIVTESTTHFGLGPNQRADVARVLWTNGIPTNVVNPNPNQQLSIPQLLVGSCPYLYTWNGERFEFVTDLLWNAPLGLKFAEHVIAPWREWEYIKIDGTKLKSVDSEYQLRVTAELWEAEYFDQFKLFAVDHPAGTEIYTNEKVGPAELASPKIHTVQKPLRPVAARDPQGRDLLQQIDTRDAIYTKTFEHRLAQGLTEEHFLELDLGPMPESSDHSKQQITLFLTGWMYPGCTSLSVQFSQNPVGPRPRPPAIYVPDAQGVWQEVRPFMGFPGGKTKTIAVDLSGLFTGDDHRLRIVSTIEIYWDAVFFTVDDPTVTFKQTELELVRAVVSDRGGVSRRSWPATGNGPDQFDYHDLVQGEAWPPMFGNFTRFGDVLPLLTQRDDKLVVTGSGDEIQLAFAEPAEPLPPGWVRDFVLYSVGWDKDADLNTVYGDVVEPLPFEAMTVYAHRDGEPRPHDAEYVQYLREYQTRKRSPTKFWNQIRQQ
ncbi:FG-GAP-like repeat-containing protein [Schlesneria sp. T3-172]|uniref:CRTAC1 family protein n=1 Tax=Schlesneria sphaerica TaxID=3373610 RepID=UPI0037CC313D